MSLESEVAKTFFEHVFCPPKREKKWRVLVLDEKSTNLLSTCLRMQDIMDTGITRRLFNFLKILVVENISKQRKILPFEAIYILYPEKQSVEKLLRDFSNTPKMYNAAYVYFTIACSNELLKLISKSGCLKFFRALSILNLGFLPIESHVYSVNCYDTAWLYTCPVDRVQDMNTRFENLAEQIVTVCVALNEFPKVRYRKRSCNTELAQFVQIKLAKHKEDNPQLGEGAHKDKSILLLLDRGFDPLTPLLHDLTLQSLVRDMQDIEDNTYRYGHGKEFELTDKNKLWQELRNEHIADISKTLPNRVRQFAESKRNFLASKQKADDVTRSSGSFGDTSGPVSSTGGLVNEGADLPASLESSTSSGSLRALQTMVRELPQYQAEAASYNALVSITDSCLSVCKESINSICAVEQDLVMGQTAQGESLANPMMSLVNILRPDAMSEVDRFRLVMIYIISQGGISESNLEKILDYARLSLTYKSLVAAMSSVLGARIITSTDGTFDSPLFRGLPNLDKAPSFIQHFLPVKGKRLRDVDENSYALSRWTPFLEDILEKCISDTLDSQLFPYLVGAHPISLLASNRLAPPTDLPSSVTNAGVRGPSARFRAPSPQPPGRTAANTTAETVAAINAANAVAADASQRSSLRGAKGATRRSGSEDAKMNDHCGPRLIVFVIGGVTWPETRVCYSVTRKCLETRLAASEQSSSASSRSSGGRNSKRLGGGGCETASGVQIIKNGGGTGWNWEVVLGGTDVLIPKQFVNNLKSLAEY